MSVFRPLALPLSAVCVNRQTINYAFAFSYKKFALFELADSMRRKILFSCYCRMKQGCRLADLERTAERKFNKHWAHIFGLLMPMHRQYRLSLAGMMLTVG